MLTEIFKMAAEGDLPIWLMFGLAIFAGVVIFERAKALFFTYSVDSTKFMTQVKTHILNDEIEQAISYCAGNQKAVLPRVVKTILERADRDDDGIRNAMEIASMEAVPQVTRRLGHLAMIANVATLVGLAGTISGLIKSFQAISFADPSQKQTLLAQGISMAMNATAMGLFIAIPTMVIYSVLNARQNKILEDLEEGSSKVVDLLTSRHYRLFNDNNVFPAVPSSEPGEHKPKHAPKHLKASGS